ncbi:immediate early response 2 S homeolog [Xenopus laevis]|uniref:Immediate early response 2 S homeolog n=1 Tax=Xenopus laevis TaxID=8355 RepID=D2I901_XENLA|nr:immediate early response 2 S homeolog [Xenopus laevis]ACT67491.1 immediate early response 2B [Xenopus laevis]OCT59385.1 hypothetical protein XELAEV_18000807mg [Xenopus laevis]
MQSRAQMIAHQEAVHREAQRIASLSAMKLLRDRTQRGGMRLHRSLQLAMVLRSAHHLIVSTGLPPEQPQAPAAPAARERESRKRRSDGARTGELVPSKRVCLWQVIPRPQPQGGAFPGMAEILQRLLGSVPRVQPVRCREALGLPGFHSRTVEAF